MSPIIWGEDPPAKMDRLGCLLMLACFISGVIGMALGLIIGAAEVARRAL